ncbi:PPE family protein [Mycobacterium paraterrae]|uniref:PPE family protein n=1 Tax=Mycobacterium paraterrae TaxID=577492 RepID=A0ABY3VLT0_9MYCO|nr:PPE family protein [Mycobacterium paraterrae]UMB68463.1 PPE family protein [Mycobacterium paraterrae]
MDFTTLPPEVISALIHSGPGSESLVDAATAWRQLGADLEDAADNYTATVSGMADAWHGPSAAAMSQSVAPYLTWLRTTSQQAQQVAAAAQAAATAFNTASATVVPTAQVLANRTLLAKLLATNIFGRNMPAIAATEAAYQEMWATNAAAMTRYQAASTQATTLPQFTSPVSMTNPSGQPEQQAQQAAAQQSSAATTAANSAATTGATSAAASPAPAIPTAFDPNEGFVGLANTYANQFISSGFPINLLSYLAQSQSAQALSGVSAQVGQGVSEGENALGGAASSLGGGAAGALGSLGGGGGLGALGAAGLSAPTAAAATGVAVPMGGLMAPPGAGTLLATSQTPVQLASAATPLGTGATPGTSMMPPLMAPPISPGSGWRKRKAQKYEDISIGAELKGNVMKPPPSAG